MKQSNFKLIGEFCLVSIFADNHDFLDIPAKIDSGADSSSLHINSAEINEAGDLVISLPSFYKRKTSPKELLIQITPPQKSPKGSKNPRPQKPLLFQRVNTAILPSSVLMGMGKNAIKQT